MKEELLSIVTHALMGVDVEKQTVDMIVEQSLELVKLPSKSVVDEIITKHYKKIYGNNYNDSSLENAKKGGFLVIEWLLNNR